MPKNRTNRVKQWIDLLMRLDKMTTLAGFARQHEIPHATAQLIVRMLKSKLIIEARKIGGVTYIAPYGKFDQYAAQWGRWFYELAAQMLSGCRSQCCRVPVSALYSRYRAKISARVYEELGLLRPIGITAFIYCAVRAYKEDAAEFFSKPFIKICREARS